MKSFKNKKIVITGAGSGLGRALAVRFSREGAALALTDISEHGLAQTRSLLDDRVASVYTACLDVSDREAVYRFAEEAQRELGGVDIVINNAGVALSETVEDTTYEDFEWVMDINFWGVVYGTKAFLPYLKQSEEAYIINISSIFGLIGVPTQAAYNASKFAVRGFTEALRQELAGTSVTPICVHPGGLKTNIAGSARFYKGMDGTTDRESAMAHFEHHARTTPENAAKTIIEGIRQGDKRVLIGYDARLIDLVQRLLPVKYDGIMKRLIGQRLL